MGRTYYKKTYIKISTTKATIGCNKTTKTLLYIKENTTTKVGHTNLWEEDKNYSPNVSFFIFLKRV